MVVFLRPASALALLFQLALAAVAQPQAATHYSVSFPNAGRHEAEITATFRNNTGKPLQIRMARSSPGRYALHEFAKNIYQIRVTDANGQALAYEQPNPHQWDVPHQGEVYFRYTLFGDRADGTYNQIDETHAHLNIPATFVYAPGLDKQPIEVQFTLPDPDWTAATQLQPSGAPETLNLPHHRGAKMLSFSAPDLQYFMDSPIELAPFTMRSWKVTNPDGKEQTIELALHHTGNDADADRMAEAAKKIVNEQQAIFGVLPDFDHHRYTFIACYMPHASGDGMEHRNSTILTSPVGLKDGFLDNLATVSHEFFHAWNVERIRPKSLEPFRFEEANMSDALWLAEGFTSYYGELAMRRAGLYSDAQYLASLQADINSYLLSPGALRFSPVYMSRQAPFVDAARSIDPTNRQNTYLSYYTYGSVLAAYLDLSLRTFPDGKNLDGFMQVLWQRFGKKEKPYQLNEIEQALADYSGNREFADNFFRKHIQGSEFLDFNPLLQRAGIQMEPQSQMPGCGYERLEETEAGLQLSSGTYLGSPLYKAGLDRGDILLKINGKKASRRRLKKFLTKARSAQTFLLEVNRHGKTFTTTLVPEPGNAIKLSLVKDQTPDNGAAIKLFRDKWLN